MKGKGGVSRRSFMAGISGLGAAGLLAAYGGGTKALGAATGYAAAGNKVDITFWNQSRGIDLKDFCGAGTAFSRAVPNVAVHCGGYSDISQVETSTAAGNPPDLVQTYAWSQLPTLIQQGAVIPLNSYMKRDHFDTSIILPGILPSTHTITGEYFGLPFMAYSTTDFFWNKKLFKQKGLDPEKPPQTLEELKTIGAKFDQYRNGKLIKVGFNPVYNISPEAWGFAFGAKFYDEKKKEITPLDPGVIRGLEWLLTYADKYGAANLNNLSAGYGLYESANNPFLNGQVAMTSFWDALPAYRDRYAPSIDMGFAPFPYPASMPHQKGWGELNFNLCFIPKSAAHPDQAWELLKFIEQNIPINITVANELANTPQNVHAVHSSHNNAPAILADIQKYVASPKQQSFPPPIPVAAQYATEWAAQTQLIFAGKVSIKDGLNRVLNAVQPALDKALKGGA